jgi:putative flippase GtrA
MLSTGHVPRELLRILRFGVVGSAGFAIDAGVLIFLIERLNGNPIEARLLSAPGCHCHDIRTE